MPTKNFPRKIADKYMENLKQATGKNCTQVRPKICQQNPQLCSFSLQFLLYSEQPFYENYSTLDSHAYVQTLLFLTRLSTRQDGFQYRVKVQLFTSVCFYYRKVNNKKTQQGSCYSHLKVSNILSLFNGIKTRTGDMQFTYTTR